MDSSKIELTPMTSMKTLVNSKEHTNTSQQDLVDNSSSTNLDDNDINVRTSYDDNGNSNYGFGDVTRSQWIIVIILCYVNLINYMDRYTIAAVLAEVKGHFQINDKEAGFLQTVFIVSYMLFAPIFGYLGDRYDRSKLMAFGVLLWCITTFLGSLMNTYFSFLMLRAFVGIGEASYSTIAPTIISDIFVKNVRSKMLALFYFAIPVGLGLGYIVGIEAFKLFGSWHYSLRVTPFLGLIAIVLILAFIKDPERGRAEGSSHLEPTDWVTDLKTLINNKSFVLSTLGFTCVSFVSGALAWHGANFISTGTKVISNNSIQTEDEVTFKFGIITMVTGIIGVSLGTLMGQIFRKKYPNSDPLICACGLILASPLLFLALFMNGISTPACLFFVFFGELFLNLNWAIVADILLYVVIPTRRSFAEALQILISHALGDAVSPVIIGSMSDFLRLYLGDNNGTVTHNHLQYYDQNLIIRFKSMQYALFSTCFVAAIGGAFFIWTAMFIVADRKRVEIYTHSR